MAENNKVIFSMNKVSKVVPPKKHILKDVSLSFYYGAKIGVLGINGSGKSTLLKIIAGIEKDYEGEVVFDKKIKIGHLSQEPQLDTNLNVIENIRQGMKEQVDMLARFEELSAKMGEEMPDDEMDKVMNEFGAIQEKLEKSNAWDIDRTLDIAMDALRVPPKDADVSKLSGGEKRRVALCRLLLESPDVLILDEPTNHLDAESVQWLELFLNDFAGTVIAVTHDRYFLDNVAEWILELDRGEGIPFKGNYSSWLKAKHDRSKLEQKMSDKRQKTLKRELEWIRQGAKGRQAKSKARISAYENLLSVDSKANLDSIEINIPIPPRLGEKVIDIKDISKAFEDKLLIDDLSLSIPRGAIVGIIGANGAGKSTLFKMITGQENPDKGNISIGETVNLAYVDQTRDDLDANKNIWEVISEGQEHIDLGGSMIHSRAYVGNFGFKGQDQQKIVGKLSGGERNRVHLARLLKSGGNVLLLDEPTNDLDVETLRALEDTLLDFAGCVLVVSHDRYFLDRISTHILSFEGDSKVFFYTGNYTEYEEYKIEQHGENSVKPKSIKYKKIQ